MTSYPSGIHAALDFVAIEFKGQRRKDPDLRIPAASHLFGVALILSRFGLSDDVVIAGPLHDYLVDVAQATDLPKNRDEGRNSLDRSHPEFPPELLRVDLIEGFVEVLVAFVEIAE